MEINRSELNGNEKYYYLPQNLPVAAILSGTIRSGDLMLYGRNCLVLFYKAFSISYSYIRLGIINDPSGLESVLGSENIIVMFECERKYQEKSNNILV